MLVLFLVAIKYTTLKVSFEMMLVSVLDMLWYYAIDKDMVDNISE